MKFVHLINPVKVKEDRDLFYAQPVTFETFKIAKNFSDISIEQFSVQFEEDREIIPNHITIIDNLTRSIKDLGDYQFKLPFFKDILDLCYENTNSEYIIYSDSDIALMPNFYSSINALIEKGHDSIIINRRDITSKFKDIDDIPMMWSEIGHKHPGWDCYVFKKDLYKKFNLGDTIVGAVGDGEALRANMKFHSKNFIELEDAHLTFHIGISPRRTNQFSNSSWVKCNLHNNKEVKLILSRIISDCNGVNVDWAIESLKAQRVRTKRFEEGLFGEKRFIGYWKLKRLLNFLALQIMVSNLYLRSATDFLDAFESISIKNKILFIFLAVKTEEF